MVSDSKLTSGSHSSITTGFLGGNLGGLPSVYVDDSVQGIDASLEDLVEWANQTFGSDQLVSAKEEFYWKMGKVFPEDPFFHGRMGYFLDFFIFQRPLALGMEASSGRTPFEVFKEKAVAGAESAIKAYRHSLFEVQKVGEAGLTVSDWLTQEKFTLCRRANESFEGIQKRDLIQGFLYIGTERIYISRGLIFHPMPAAKVIKKSLKKAKKATDFDDFSELSKLARQELRHRRHHNVDPKVIYSQEPK